MSVNGYALNLADVAPACESSTPEFAASLYPALTELLKAYDYAESLDRDRWEFAVGIDRLRRLRLTESDVRWLICKGYCDQAVEITCLEDLKRQFRATRNLSLSKRANLVLTDMGATAVRTVMGCDSHATCCTSEVIGIGGAKLTVPVPFWDCVRHELKWNGRLVKRFKRFAANQETILAAFQEEGWPSRIDDPLPPQGETDAKRRLHDAIKCLNKNQKHNLIHFRGDGSGEGVLWERSDRDSEL